MDFDDLTSGLIGAPLFGVKIKLIDWEEGGYRVKDKPNSRGEAVVGGHNIANGYYKLEKETNESFEMKDGIRWFKTGDIVEVNSFGLFKVIDRKKDFVKLQFGEYISLGKVSFRKCLENFFLRFCAFC
jgi:long-chain acyl-CoA synthetase